MVTPSVVDKKSPIVIVGAGIFGLSTSIHLAERGYTNVLILDKQPYEETLYSYNAGCDAASADTNKFIRAAYGSQIEYQSLALEALTHWKHWNAEIADGNNLPPGFTNNDVIYVNNGTLSLNSDNSVTQFDVDSRENMNKAGFSRTQILLTDKIDAARAKADGFGFAINPFGRPEEKNYGHLDTVGGFVYADKACQYALYKAKSIGVKTLLGGPAGTFSSFIFDADGTYKVIGVKTVDNRIHNASLTVMACGGWTPSLLPQLDGLCETTGGSVCTFQLPADPVIWSRFAPENFPTWSYKMRDGEKGGLYGFARDPHGAVKVGYRGIKFTNPQVQEDGNVRSVPVTRWTSKSLRKLPHIAADVIMGFVKEFLPELTGCETKTRICWYTDSFDNHFVIDFVPDSEGLMVVTGGSGHAFKFLPNIGEYVVNRIEGKMGHLLELWRWRSLENGKTPHNSIMEGMTSPRALNKQILTKDDSLTS